MKLKREILWNNKGFKDKMTNKTNVIIMMLMRYFTIWIIVIMMTLLFRKLFYDVLITVYRLKQYREQYCYSKG
ncbi:MULTISPECIES: hypothetical protein [Flavobacterium]|uniref:hypothetical protein n=1 Tax=Flavobacterium TaxID=237 RepID=UPI0016434E18|nr:MULTISPECIES: hypothetical protein [Flavobacterium]MCR4031888.1 hypothetical protein [Flavobacterium panacis]